MIPEQQTLDFMSTTTVTEHPSSGFNNGYIYMEPYNWDVENNDLKMKLHDSVDTIKKLNKVIKLLVETRDYGRL